MVRATKTDIERDLLAGKSVAWKDASGKSSSVTLGKPEERRLLAFLLKSRVRQPTELPPEFIDGLSTALAASDDPATAEDAAAPGEHTKAAWRLKELRTEGFGGLNTWQGGQFTLAAGSESMLLEGPNGSGKSSLVGALIWALSGERPREQSDSAPHEPQPVLFSDERRAGEWPPIASYPGKADGLTSSPFVKVELVFADESGAEAIVRRTLKDGEVIYEADSALSIPAIMLETGLLMPARLTQLRFDSGPGRLTDAVQKLTGLDDLIEIGTLTEGLCHKSREYRSFKSKEIGLLTREFEQALSQARTALEPAGMAVPHFKPVDTKVTDGDLAKFGSALTAKAAELSSVIATDIASNIDVKNLNNQQKVLTEITLTKANLGLGLAGFDSWKILAEVEQAIDEVVADNLLSVIAAAQRDAHTALQLKLRAEADSRLQLKAVGARWHAAHASGHVEDCPLCEQTLAGKASLAHELDSLATAGEELTRTYSDNIQSIEATVDAATPRALLRLGDDPHEFSPSQQISAEVRSRYVTAERFAECLTGVASIVDRALHSAPVDPIPFAASPKAEAPSLERLTQKLHLLERGISLARWYRARSQEWELWWKEVLQGSDRNTDSQPSEGLSDHLDRLNDALVEAAPYRRAAEAMRVCWKVGSEAAAIQDEIALRETIAEHLMPLKSLGALCEAIARDAINDLSKRVAALYGEFSVDEQLSFSGANLKKKVGLVVQGHFTPDLKIDATLVANTSWIRAILWCFIFSLREEAVEQHGYDAFPVMVFDDPQATFDAFHRVRWARYVASQQNADTPVQILLTTYDESFLELIKADGVVGREAMLSAPGPSCDHVSILEGALLDREWAQAEATNTPRSGVDYVIRVRIYVEGLLKIMLRGEDPHVPKMVLGDLRTLLRQLHEAHKAPWDRSIYKTLLGRLDSGRPEIKYLEGSHHTTGQNYGMNEAKLVEKQWRSELRPSLDRGFKVAREYRLLHGGMKALYASSPTVSLPDGYQAKVRSIPLTVLGKAAALTDGRAADGKVEWADIDEDAHVKVVLGKHFAFRLAAKTLEPVARPGDILLVKEFDKASPKSLVVALSDERLLARRFEIADNHSDVAVLTAHSISPREIASPVVAHKSTFSLHKIVGVLYDYNSSPALGANEICDCGGESALGRLTASAIGLVEVEGQSAEPYALDGQFLMIAASVTGVDNLRALEGRPVIAADGQDNRYFKRLRLVGNGQVVLESLENGGDFPPIVLSIDSSAATGLKAIWPVVGVLFERV